MEQRNSEVVEIDVKELYFVLLHKIWVIILIGLLGTLSVGAISNFLIKPTYTSSTSVYVINRQDENKMTYSDIQTGTQLTKDYMILVKSRPVTEQVIKNLNLNMTSEQLYKMIQVNTPQDTRILEITVKNHDPNMAKMLADAIAEVSSERMVSVMEMEKVNVMEQGNLPTDPSSPNVIKNAILGGLLGVILASFILIVVNLMNDSIRTSEDIEKYLGITTLGTIPLEEGSNKKRLKIKQNKGKRKDALAS